MMLPCHSAVAVASISSTTLRCTTATTKRRTSSAALFLLMIAAFLCTCPVVVVANNNGSGVPPVNDLCEDAILLETTAGAGGGGGLTERTGTTINATNDYTNVCGENLSNEPTVWYRYKNTATSSAAQVVVTISTCSAATNFDTALTVYSGSSCSALACVGGIDNDLECRLDDTNNTSSNTQRHSTIAWHAEPGRQYYILVHGSEPHHAGDFGLVLTESEPLAPPDDNGDSTTSNAGGGPCAAYSSGRLVVLFVTVVFAVFATVVN